MMSEHRFREPIRIIGINPYVEVPGSISAAYGIKGSIPVKGRVNDYEIRATLVPIGIGRHRLYINGEMREGAGVGVGDTIDVVLDLDTEPRIESVPAALTKAFELNQKAREVYENYPPSHRREILRYLNSLKNPESVEKNVEKLINILEK